MKRCGVVEVDDTLDILHTGAWFTQTSSTFVNAEGLEWLIRIDNLPKPTELVEFLQQED
jgi:hypothetical protein